MKIISLLAALLVVPSLAISARAEVPAHQSSLSPQIDEMGGHEVAAPSWSAACMTDHGPSQCGEPMWIYGSRAATQRYRNPF
jgi:hypothetical protein